MSLADEWVSLYDLPAGLSHGKNGIPTSKIPQD